MEENMRIIQSLDEMTETARGWLIGGTVGYVPTMGYLHAGHLALLREARRASEVCIASIVTGPLPFASPNDSRLLPYDKDRDLQMLAGERVDVAFIPRVADLFPPHFQTLVYPDGPITKRLEGAVRPDFFRGYATLMAKLFSLVRPDVVYLGQKNAQLVALVQQLVRDLNIDVKVQVLPTVREADNLAASSRTQSLTPAERQAASLLYAALLAGKALIDQGERRLSVIEAAMMKTMAASPLVLPEYATACHPETFADPGSSLPAALTDQLLVLAARVGHLRLTDNLLMRDGQWLM
jgi:pantoate--beta-alanine ligase